jgi:hypothetical protein
MLKLLSVLVLSTGLVFALFGCSDEQPSQQRVEKRSGLAKFGTSDWLMPQDDVQPEDWLIAHEAKHGFAISSISDPRDVRRALNEASEKFHDSPRMIANRAVQLEGMLKEEGGGETAIVLISGLNRAVSANRIESFGAAGQQYYNMRKAGFTGEQALDALSKRYGSRS